MIIYGTRASKGKFIQTTTQCPFCGKEHAVGVLPYHKYFHVWWIPIIPYGKEYVVACGACGHEVPDHYVGGITPEIRKQAKSPWWIFIGLAIIAVIVLSILFEIISK
jgi:hypothetical protein